MIIAIIFMFSAILLTGIGQIFLKIGSNYHQKQNFWDPYLNYLSLTGYCLYLVSTIFLFHSLKEVPLKMYGAMSSLNFIIVLFFSFIFLNENINISKIFAVALIVMGLVIFNI